MIESRLEDLSVGDAVRGKVVRIGGVEVVVGEQFKRQSPEFDLDRWTGDCRMGAVHTAITGFRLQCRSTAAATVERRTRLRGHRLRLGSIALGAGNRRLQDYQIFQGGHREAANQLGVPSGRKPAPPPSVLASRARVRSRRGDGAGPLLTSLGTRESPPVRRPGWPNPDQFRLLYSAGDPTVRDPNDASGTMLFSIDI